MITDRHRAYVLAVDEKYGTTSFRWHGFALRAGWDVNEVPRLFPELVRFEYMVGNYGVNPNRLKPADTIRLTDEGHLAAEQWRQQADFGYLAGADPVDLARQNVLLKNDNRRLVEELRVLADEDRRLYAENQKLAAHLRRLHQTPRSSGDKIVCPACSVTAAIRASFCPRCGTTLTGSRRLDHAAERSVVRAG